MSEPPLLQVDNLYTHFQTERGLVRAVDGVSFTLDHGVTLGLVGESGCGKTILCRTLMGLLPKSAKISPEARVVFNGHDLRGLDERSLREIRGREVAMIFQDPMTSLNPVMKVGAQIAETLIHHLRMSKNEARDRGIELLRAVGISSPERRIDEFPHQLSGGIRQRVAIAIALACEPKLLIADEPTTALDVTVQAGILDLLQQQQRERHMSMILITHDLGVVAGRTDEIAVMYAGKLVERSSTKALFANTRMPYTQALMESIPHLDQPTHTRLKTISGHPPNLINPPLGCRFAPRCSRADEHCQEAEPSLRSDDGADHTYACWRPVGQPPTRAAAEVS
ncbi:MAG: ABC transporter ATP-binding protein [Alphaproteobacteria bacterium]|jgi:peptide/nickel transport system ATP-binding protein|nr:ABC transporter ATP-binding protein [Alphaproteobacteria bacterium]MDP6813415.1 ABC transporter ATP-binding protein [Alphaproteobacteria bacterium]